MKAPARTFSLACCCLLFVGSFGCTTMRPGVLQGKLQGNSEQAQDYAGPVVTMSIRPASGKPKSVVIPLEQGMTVQTVLEQQKLTRRFKNMKINVMRVTPESGGQRAPLRAEYDTVKNRVGILHDFALYPGDHIVVEEDNTTRFDELVGRFGGMLGARR